VRTARRVLKRFPLGSREGTALAGWAGRFPRAAWVFASVGWGAVIFLLSAQTSEARGPAPFLVRVLWNGAHAPFFAVLGGLLVASLARRSDGRLLPDRASLLGAIVLAALYGLADEWHQSFVPGRNPSVLDAATDLFGAGFGSVVVAWGLGGRVGGRWGLWVAGVLAGGAAASATIGAI